MHFLFFLLLVITPAQRLQQGLVALQRGDLPQARLAFEEVTKQEPGNAYAWASLAETFARLKLPTAAAASAAKAEKLGADNPAINHALAMYFSRQGQLAHAAELEQKYAGSDQADPSAQERTAVLFLNAGNVPEAVTAAQRAVQDHASPGAENILGRALTAAGQTEAGEPHLAAAWNGMPSDSHFAFDYVQTLLRKQDFGKASDVLAKTLESHPNDPQLVLALGVARYGQRRFEDAIGTFLKVIQIDPQVDQPYIFLGKMLDQAGDHLTEITADYEKWSAHDTRQAIKPLLLAKARLAADPKDPRAEDLLRRAIALDARNWEAHYELGVLLEGKRNWQAAAAELKRSSELDPKQAMPHYHLARVYDRLGNSVGAKAEREQHDRITTAPR